MFVCYTRVSTTTQEAFRQADTIQKYLNENNISAQWVNEKKSGKDFENRPLYMKLKKILKEGDTLIVSSLDRFGRNYQQIIDEWRYFRKKGVDIVVLDMPILTTKTNEGIDKTFLCDLILQVLSYVAEKERINIKERQRQGIESAMARGVRFGRPKKQLTQEQIDLVKEYKARRENHKDYMKMTGLARGTFFRLVKEL